MIGYAESEIFPEYMLEDLRLATRHIERFPGKDSEGRWIRCHELVRAIAPLLSPTWTVTDGFYITVDHSWLTSPSGIVLDLSAIGQLPQVRLVDAPALFFRRHYRPSLPRHDIRGDIVEWLTTIPDQRDATNLAHG